jgi:hypothetical protein
MEMDQGPLTARLRGGYSIVSDSETQLKPIVVPGHDVQKDEQCDLYGCRTMRCRRLPWGIALRSGFKQNAQIQRLRQRVTTGRFNDDMKAWIRTKYACDEGESNCLPFSISEACIRDRLCTDVGIAFTSRVAPYVYTTRIHQ